MTTRVHRVLALVAALLPAAAVAHEVDCEKTVGLVQVDRSGAPVLGQDLLPLFVTTPAASLVVNQYPAVVGWRIRVNNLAAEPSIIGSFSDPLLDTSGTVATGTLPVPGLAIPVGGATEAVVLQRIDSYEQCVGLPPPTLTAPASFSVPLDEHMCRDGLTNVFTVVTESNLAQCRARIICQPPPPPPPPPLPSTCQTVNGVTWCYNPDLCGAGCEAVCTSLGMALTISDTDWFNAQNTQAKCDAIANAFGITTPSTFGSFTYACVEDLFGNHTPGGPLIAPLHCSALPECPANHRVTSDEFGVPCAAAPAPVSRQSICPCSPVVPTLR